MKRIYGYCRVSTAKQNIERQVRNILKAYPDAHIYKEKYTGTKHQERKELNKILKQVKPGDVIVFDSVSRMSRNASEGIKLYMDLFDQNIELIFLKEPLVNTETYRAALKSSIDFVGNEIADVYIEATNKVLKMLAARQIELAFGQAEKEVMDLHQRTAEGIETARRAGKQIGRKQGDKLVIKKAVKAKQVILKSSKTFGGTLTNVECARAAGVSLRSFYKYKNELKKDVNN